MRIVYIAAGAGGMYCGACARDVALVRALQARGHDVHVLPLYTPLRRDGAALPATARVFYGGINVFLQQASSLFRRTPEAFDRVLDNPALLKWVSQFAISTDPSKLGAMTVSVLAGEDGRQRKELHKLLDYLAGIQPEIVVITNSLLSAIAPAVKARLGVPVVCLLQGEEEFVSSLGEPFRTQAIELMRAHAASVDLYVASYQQYVEEMAEFLNEPSERIALIRAGLDIPPRLPGPRHREPFTVGYISVITPGKGLDLLVDAVKRLKEAGREAHLLIAGKVMNPLFWQNVRQEIQAAKLSHEYLGEVDYEGKQAFFHRCSAFSVPSRQHEARGMSFMEAQQAGVPVAAPEAGVFPEMLSLTGGGLLFPSSDSAGLATALARLQDAPEEADRLGRVGMEGIARHYSAARIAEEVEGRFTALTSS
ncbi:MAG: glycosyltransferase family 4 protein [Armatimonadota bacterium]